MSDTERHKEQQYSDILADFVACTGIQDEGEAIRYLENVNWDLLAAIHLVMPHHSQRLPSEAAATSNSSLDNDVEMLSFPSEPFSSTTTFSQSDPSIITIAPDEDDEPMTASVGVASTSSGKYRKSRLIQFNILYNKNIIHVTLAENKTIHDLKLEVFSKTGLQICKQYFKGWPNGDLVFNDRTILSSLLLPSKVELTMDSKALPPQNGHSSLKKKKCDASEASKIYKLNISDLTNGKEYNLKYGGNTKVRALKEDVAVLTKIPISQQLWTGWSDQDDSDSDASTSTSRKKQGTENRDELPLYKSGISYPNHDFTVEAARPTSLTTNSDLNKSIVDIADTDSSMDEYEDASESFTGEDSSVDNYPEMLSRRRKLNALIPDNVEDEVTGTIHFIEEFESRYGDQRPHFYPGSLDDAIKEACFRPAKERKILAVYLHHDASVLTNVFCSQLLCFESVLQHLATNCVVWGWDLTYKSNQAKFLTNVSSCLGSVATMMLRTHMEVDRLPALVLIMRMRATTEIFTVINGNVGVSELMSSLIQAVDVFSAQQKTEIREEEERTQRELIKIEQDEAYQQSLAVDRAKEESKRRAEQLLEEEKARVDAETKATVEKKEALKKRLLSLIPPEPTEPSGSTGVITIRFRCPQQTSGSSHQQNGGGESSSTTSLPAAAGSTSATNMMSRKFYASEPVENIINYLIVQGYDTEDYKIIFGWPRKEMTLDIASKTLSELKFCAQETLIVEER